MVDRELDLLSLLIDNAKQLVEINTPKFDKEVFDTNINKILKLLNEVFESNSNPKLVKIISRFKNDIEASSVDKDKFMDFIPEYYLEELDHVEVQINNVEKLDEAIELAYSMESMFVNYELDRFINELNGLQAKYDYSKSII